MTDEETQEPAVKITLSSIYNRVVAVESQVAKLGEGLPAHVSITKSKQDEYDARLENHGTRLSTLDTRVTLIEATKKPSTPWHAVVTGVVSIITGAGSLIALIAVLSKLSTLAP